MEKGKTYPFVRNRYYTGKLLTSGDFLGEQEYHSSKRRFFNRLFFDYGVICGLEVTALDAFSLMVDSGAAVDSSGREIIVDKPIMKRLSVLPGFEDTRTGKLSLCLEYKEQEVNPVLIVNKKSAGDDSENNNILESYRLFLAEREETGFARCAGGDVLEELVLYQDADHLLTLRAPRTVSRHTSFYIKAELEKLTDTDRSFHFSIAVQTPAFLTHSGEKEFTVTFSEAGLNKGERRIQDHMLTASEKAAEKASLIAGNQTMLLHISEEKPEELIRELTASVNLDQIFTGTEPRHLLLADIDIVRDGDSCMIKSIHRPADFREVATPAKAALADVIAQYYAKNGASEMRYEKSQEEAAERQHKREEGFQPEMLTDSVCSSGSCEIPLGIQAKAGSIFYSDEIMHRLGKGSVCVQLGLEYEEDDRVKGAFSQKILYGDPLIFAEESGRTPRFETAVRVNVQNGTFQVGIRLLEATKAVTAALRWFAFRVPEKDHGQAGGKAKKGSIVVRSSSVVLEPHESVFFDVEFRDMEPVSCCYEVVESAGGEITADGIYTAPGREGVYEILISCVEDASIYTYAYAVVRKKV